MDASPGSTGRHGLIERPTEPVDVLDLVHGVQPVAHRLAASRGADHPEGPGADVTRHEAPGTLTHGPGAARPPTSRTGTRGADATPGQQGRAEPVRTAQPPRVDLGSQDHSGGAASSGARARPRGPSSPLGVAQTHPRAQAVERACALARARAKVEAPPPPPAGGMVGEDTGQTRPVSVAPP